jgi:hypothetical protein
MVTDELLIASIKRKEEQPRGDLIKQGSSELAEIDR